jgi:hypothetical protein
MMHFLGLRLHDQNMAAYKKNSWAQGSTAKASREHNEDLIRPSYALNKAFIRLLVSTPGLFYTLEFYTPTYEKYEDVYPG